MFYEWIILVCILDFKSLAIIAFLFIKFGIYKIMSFQVFRLLHNEAGQYRTGWNWWRFGCRSTSCNTMEPLSCVWHWSLVCCLFSTLRFVALLILLPVCFMLIYKFIWFCDNIVFYFQNWCGWASVYSFMHLSFITYYIFFFLSSGLLLIKPSTTSVGGIGLLIDVASNGLREFSSKLVCR